MKTANLNQKELYGYLVALKDQARILEMRIAAIESFIEDKNKFGEKFKPEEE